MEKRREVEDLVVELRTATAVGKVLEGSGRF
jgi:hypothetical protein